MNIPNNVLKFPVKPELANIDYTSLEVRVEQAVLRDFSLESLYKRLTGKENEVPFTEDQRRALKAISFGEIYGISEEGLREAAAQGQRIALPDPAKVKELFERKANA